MFAVRKEKRYIEQPGPRRLKLSILLKFLSLFSFSLTARGSLKKKQWQGRAHVSIQNSLWFLSSSSSTSSSSLYSKGAHNLKNRLHFRTNLFSSHQSQREPSLCTIALAAAKAAVFPSARRRTKTLSSSQLRCITSMPLPTWAAPTPPSPPMLLPVFRYPSSPTSSLCFKEFSAQSWQP